MTEKKAKEHFLTDDSFKLINEAQAKIIKATGFKPSAKRLANEIICQQATDHAVERLIEKLGS